MDSLIIDGIIFNVPLVEIKIDYSFLEKYANRTENGDIKIDTIGGYQNYTVKIGTLNDSTTFKKIWDIVTDPTNRFHTVTVPDATGYPTFYGYFSSVSASVEKVLNSKVKYKDFSFKMTSKKPTRKK